MSLNPFFSDEAARAQCDAVAALCNSGTLKVYSGTQPTDANTAIGAQVLLGTFNFGSTAFAASSCSGSTPNRKAVATANAIADTTAVATGTASFFRAFKSNGTSIICDGTVGTSGCDLNLTDITLTTDETMSVTSLTLSAPE